MTTCFAQGHCDKELDGRAGACGALDSESGLYTVRLDDESGEGVGCTCSVKRENLRLLKEEVCLRCGKSGDPASTGGVRLLRCAGCMRARFCGRECQVAVWKEHKAECGRVRATFASVPFEPLPSQVVKIDLCDDDPIGAMSSRPPPRAADRVNTTVVKIQVPVDMLEVYRKVLDDGSLSCYNK